jgi:hypothetical protein
MMKSAAEKKGAAEKQMSVSRCGLVAGLMAEVWSEHD